MSKLEAMTDVTIGWEKGDKFAEANLPAGHRLNNKLQKLHEQRPEDFPTFYLNSDGSLYAKFPISWVKISPPKQLSEEQIEIAKKNLEKARA